MSALLTTLPGDIPGLLRRGSPLWVRGAQTVAVVLYDGRVAYATKGGLNHDALGAVELDLDDPTGRAHAAWWAEEKAPGVSILTPPGDGFMSPREARICHRAVYSVPMTPIQIDHLARLVLRLSGRTP